MVLSFFRNTITKPHVKRLSVDGEKLPEIRGPEKQNFFQKSGKEREFWKQILPI